MDALILGAETKINLQSLCQNISRVFYCLLLTVFLENNLRIINCILCITKRFISLYKVIQTKFKF